MHIIELSDLNILAAVTKVETEKELKSYFEAIEDRILPCNPIARNKAYSNKTEKFNVSNTDVASMVGGMGRETNIDLRF